MATSNVISISEAPHFHSHKSRSTSRRKPDSIFNSLRKIGVNPGMVLQLEIRNEAGGERPREMFEQIFETYLFCEAEPIMQALAKKHGAGYVLLYDRFRAVNL